MLIIITVYFELQKMVDNLLIYDLESKTIPKTITGQERVKRRARKETKFHIPTPNKYAYTSIGVLRFLRIFNIRSKYAYRRT